jgi:hypothetical protein
MTHARTLVIAAVVVVAICGQALAAGIPHQVLGTATYANNTVPQGFPEMRFEAYITARPTEVLTEATVGCGIQYIPSPPECWWWVECGNFQTPWSDSELLRIDFWGDGTNNPPTFRPESAYILVVLDESVGSQDVGEIEIPVELSTFAADGGEEEVVLRWTTASETNNLGFFVHRATSSTGPWDRVNEELIPGAGMSGTPHQYVYRDPELAPGEYWYELEDVSALGTSNRHGPVSVLVSPLSKLAVTGAHVVGDELHLSFSVPRTGMVKGAIYNVAGREARVLFDQRLDAGRQRLTCDLEGVSSGLYFCRVQQEGFEEALVRLPIIR